MKKFAVLLIICFTGTVQADRLPGPGQDVPKDPIKPYHTYTYENEWFAMDETAEILVAARGKNPIDVKVYDQQGNLVVIGWNHAYIERDGISMYTATWYVPGQRNGAIRYRIVLVNKTSFHIDFGISFK